MTSDNKTEQPSASAMDAASLKQQAEPHDDAERGGLFPKCASDDRQLDQMLQSVGTSVEEVYEALNTRAAPKPQGGDWEALKKENIAIFEDRGWNNCIDHLSSKYTITPIEGG